ncbi:MULTISPECIES: hypothetical protein [Streptomyces]|uniref:Uncharacterized protein n=1 Tax=Streptomyces dengpaensis TaxID=2049881 RepID=A0ABM6SYH6_9ACTN|nr:MULTISPECIES: hypothetical protein [Streptomyces]AVH59727.1 hypothetical protein C4B68_32685 [Streptomyces dengpaensis]PIB09371.1 hypothetical protein B1C81_09365 [Streptomyces sp. HG99]
MTAAPRRPGEWPAGVQRPRAVPAPAQLAAETHGGTVLPLTGPLYRPEPVDDEFTTPEAVEEQAVDRQRIIIDSEPGGIVNVAEAIESGALPETYVRQGALVQVAQVAGAINPEQGVDHEIRTLTPDSMRFLLAQHADVVAPRGSKDGEVRYVATSPSVSVCRAVLSNGAWTSIPALANLVFAPVIRPDGTVLQKPGYDPSTRLYYVPRLRIAPVPDRPTGRDIAEALDLLLGQVLADIPWDSDADRANYVGLLVSLMLRPYIGGLLPFGAFSATERGSGKTLLTDAIKHLYGAGVRAWVSDDDELRKSITAALMGSSPAIVFDNVGEHDNVSAPSLAKLLTNATWDDRMLGRNTNVSLINDRLWLVTGNNIRFGGDIAQRTALVRLNARCARPDLRTGFRIPDLFAWLENQTNQAALMRALLILCRDWIAAGAPQADFQMRNFSRWARNIGGFLAHHDIRGFLDNRDRLEEQDEEQTTWATFYAQWWELHTSTAMTTAELIKSSRPEPSAFGPGEDPWNGVFLARSDGKPLSAVSLGKMLATREDRHIGGFTLTNPGRNRVGARLWSLRRAAESTAEGTQGTGSASPALSASPAPP